MFTVISNKSLPKSRFSAKGNSYKAKSNPIFTGKQNIPATTQKK
ncbi:hypothetical protein [Hippea maritima]|nr:hypothetical protein [Hippea maritima]